MAIKAIKTYICENLRYTQIIQAIEESIISISKVSEISRIRFSISSARLVRSVPTARLWSLVTYRTFADRFLAGYTVEDQKLHFQKWQK